MQISKLVTPEEIQNVILTYGDLRSVDGRRSGNTTGTILRAIGYSILNPDVPVRIIEQSKHPESYIVNGARDMIARLKLEHIHVYKEGREVVIISRIRAQIVIGERNQINFKAR